VNRSRAGADSVEGVTRAVTVSTPRRGQASRLRRSRRAFAEFARGGRLARHARMRRLALAIATVSTGCATMMQQGTANHVSIVTNPAGARVWVDDLFVGTTPSVIALDRQHNAGLIHIEAPGYVPVTIVRARGIDDWFWGNLLSFGVVGMLVDFASGAAQGFDETPIAVQLTPVAPCQCAP
jgi:hypothetical protein